MCLIVCAFRAHPDYPLVLVANRDEFHERPTRPADFWEDKPDLVGGRDLRAGGTWLGASRRGRVAAVTNYRELEPHQAGARSRGRLVTEFLCADQAPEPWLETLAPAADRYAGFSLLVAAGGRLAYLSNREEGITELSPGLYGMSNHLLETPWHKVVRSKARLARALEAAELDSHSLLDLLLDREAPAHAELPDTGLDADVERRLLPAFIVGERYGTRSTAAVTISYAGELDFAERSFAPAGSITDERHFSLSVPGWDE